MLGKLEEAKILAGGQTLIPTMKQRLAQPGNLIDLSAIAAELSGIEVKGRSIVIGAMTRHVEVANSADREGRASRRWPISPVMIGDPAVRHRGTHRRLGRQQRPERRTIRRRASASARRSTPPSASTRRTSSSPACSRPRWKPDEIVTKISFPVAQKAGYDKFRNPASRFALVGVFAAKRGSEIRVAVTGAGANGVFRVPSFEEALKKRFAPKSLEGLTIPADGMNGDIHGSAGIPRPSGRRDGPPAPWQRANDLSAVEGEEEGAPCIVVDRLISSISLRHAGLPGIQGSLGAWQVSADGRARA